MDITSMLSPWTVQSPWLSQAQIKALMDAQVDAGVAAWFWSKDGLTAWFVRHYTPWVAEVHLFSKTPHLVRNCREIQARVWAETNYRKLEMRTPLNGVATLAKRIGWTHEGTRLASFQMQDGRMENEYLYGVVKNG